MLFSDDDADAVRVFEHGKGRVVFVAQNYFQNASLQSYDHAELLLGLADLNREATAILIVQRPDVPTWYAALWAMAPLCLAALAVALLLWAWAAVRSFGPRLPEPDLARRSLLEHVNASSRWLWKTGKGRSDLAGGGARSDREDFAAALARSAKTAAAAENRTPGAAIQVDAGRSGRRLAQRGVAAAGGIHPPDPNLAKAEKAVRARLRPPFARIS